MDQMNDMEIEPGARKVHNRKKKLYQSILQQMEFYFGDANLRKDRFLGNLVQQDKYVDLAVFLKFNKIRCHTSNIEDLVKALQKSELLSISEDGTKVCRTTPVKQKKNEDECTIYVEQLPPDADHDWLKEIFSAYGKVEYVSIPKYKRSGKIKGFAFVEFATPQEAEKTLEAFSAMGCHLSTQMSPEQLCSITTFEGDDKGPTTNSNGYGEERAENVKENLENEADDNQEEETKIVSKKRKQENITKDEKEEKKCVPKSSGADGQDSDVSSKKKKRKYSGESCVSESTEADLEEVHVSSKKKKKVKGGENLAQSTEINPEESDVSQKKKKLKGNDNEDDNARIDPEDIESPAEKRKKNGEDDALDTGQDETAPNKKKRMHEEEEEAEEYKYDAGDGCRKTDVDEGEEEQFEETLDASRDECKKKKRRKHKKRNKKEYFEADGGKWSLKILSKHEWKRLRNKYLELQKSQMKAFKQHLARNRNISHKQEWRESQQPKGEEIENNSEQSQPRVAFIPGTIIHIQLDEPVTNVKKFKADVKIHPEIKYIDVQEGANEAYIRCGTPEIVQQLVSDKPWKNMVVLEGDAQSAYWEKIKHDRKEKIEKKIRVSHRGRDKLLKKAESELGKHMRFDD